MGPNRGIILSLSKTAVEKEAPDNQVSPEEEKGNTARRKVEEGLARVKDTLCQMRSVTIPQPNIFAALEAGFQQLIYPLNYKLDFI